MKQKQNKQNQIFLTTLSLLLLMLLFSHCSRLDVDIEPDDSAVYHSLKLGVQVKNLHTNKSQSFKAILKYNQWGDKMMFLSPLNQVYGMLFVENEKTLLINTKKKKYWRGDFNLLLQWMWGEEMDFLFSEFKHLVIDGVVPQGKTMDNGIKITIDKVDSDNKPGRIQLESQDILVKVKITDHQTGKGKLQLTSSLKGMKKADIAKVME